MKRLGVIAGVSVSHRNAAVDDIECASRRDEEATVRELLDRSGVSEAFLLQTCNRAEAYVVAESVTAGREALADFAPGVPADVVVELGHEESLRHLMRVASGLESLVLGEDQILGQFSDAIEQAREAGGIGPIFEEALTKALHVGERARAETAINEGVVSLGSAAVKLAEERLDVTDASALVVGAGQMGRLAARALAAADVDRLRVANRTAERAAKVAEEVAVPATTVDFAELATAVASVDLVITATSSDAYVVEAATLADAGDVVVVDIAQPRDVDPAGAEFEGVTIHDIDDLEAVTEHTQENRQAEADAVGAMIDAELDRLLETFKRKRADEAISKMYESADRLKADELDRAFSKLEAQGDLTDQQRETVEALADALVGKLLAAPTKSLREAAAEDDWTTIQTAMQLFDPGFDYAFPEASAPGADADAPEASGDDAPDGETAERDAPHPAAAARDAVDPEELPDDRRQEILESLSDD
jgi:glutamyl-tRNA reductase